MMNDKYMINLEQSPPLISNIKKTFFSLVLSSFQIQLNIILNYPHIHFIIVILVGLYIIMVMIDQLEQVDMEVFFIVIIFYQILF